MPNTANINRLIAILKEDHGRHFAMARFVSYTNEAIKAGEIPGDALHEEAPQYFIECKTAFCLAGWVNKILMDDDTHPEAHDYKHTKGFEFQHLFTKRYVPSQWLGITSKEGEHLFEMSNHYGMRLGIFDRANPGKRLAAAVRVLEILRDEGDVNWSRALEEAGF